MYNDYNHRVMYNVNRLQYKAVGEVVGMKNILFIASEAVPFIKTGGLADVVGSLPKCFDKAYFDVRVIIQSIFVSKKISGMI